MPSGLFCFSGNGMSRQVAEGLPFSRNEIVRFCFGLPPCQSVESFESCEFVHLFFYLAQILFHGSAPAESIPPCTAFQLRSVDEHDFMICFSHLLQLANMLLIQIFNFFCIDLLESRNGTVIRRRFIP